MMSPTELLNHLSLAYESKGFRPVGRPPDAIPQAMTWYGGIESKTLNRHRAICVLGMAATDTPCNVLVEKIREGVHGLLKAKFWRGLAIGLIIFSPRLMDEIALEQSVYSAEVVKTTLVQWLINIEPESSTAIIAHTFSQVDTTPMVTEICNALGIPVSNRKVLITKPVSPLKSKLW